MAKIKTKTKKDTKNSSKSLKEKIKSLEDGLVKESEEIKRVSEKNIRLLAEFDNYKRRTQQERSNLLKYEGQSLAKSLLPILDDLNRTLEIDEKIESNAIMKGIQLIVNKFLNLKLDGNFALIALGFLIINSFLTLAYCEYPP